MGEVFRFGPAGPDDIPAIMAIERRPGYDRLVGRWEGDKHRAEMASPAVLYFALREADALAGFAIVLGLDDPNRRAHLKRIAVAAPGRGDGARLLHGLIDHVFAETETNRLDLDVFAENERAKRAYEAAGFTAEGLMREHHRMPDGGFPRRLADVDPAPRMAGDAWRRLVPARRARLDPRPRPGLCRARHWRKGVAHAYHSCVPAGRDGGGRRAGRRRRAGRAAGRSAGQGRASTGLPTSRTRSRDCRTTRPRRSRPPRPRRSLRRPHLRPRRPRRRPRPAPAPAPPPAAPSRRRRH